MHARAAFCGAKNMLLVALMSCMARVEAVIWGVVVSMQA